MTDALALAVAVGLSPAAVPDASGVPEPPRAVLMRELGAVSCVFDGRTGRPVPAEAALARVLASRVVHVGERHDEARHHEAQRRLLEEMAGRLLQAMILSRPRTAGGFEMLHVTHQAALDRYLAGGPEEAFLREVDWPRTWGYPFELYRPLFETLRDRRLPGLALNVPKPVVHKVARTGLESLTPEERRFAPADMRRTEDPAYLAMLRDTFAQHGGDPDDREALGRYLDAMTLWNEGMAQRVAAFLRAEPGAAVVVFAGAFHAYAAAIPEGVARRVPGVLQTGIVLQNADACPESLPADSLALAADLVWVLTPWH